MTQSEKMLPGERKAALSLALVYMFRMMGLFMVLPVLALYADRLPGSTPQLLGLAVGVYGLTQAVLQVPFGILSDRVGRKPVILAGLLIFALGSVVAALADHVYGVIAGRALQGAGAVAAAIMALAADLSRDSQRTKVMAIIGASIGAAFLLSLMLGPALSSLIGVSGLFWLTVALAICGALVVGLVVPTPKVLHKQAGFSWGQLAGALRDRRLLALDLSIFALHGSLMAIFVVVPFQLRDMLELSDGEHWKIYLPVMLLALLIALPVIMRSGRSGSSGRVLKISVGLLGVAVLGMALAQQWLSWLSALVVYFVAFNVLEASLPSLVSKLVPGSHKGAALGVYSTSQFLGTFVGGAVGGWVYGSVGAAAVMYLGGAIVAVWLLLLAGVSLRERLASCAVSLPKSGDEALVRWVEALESLAGVEEVLVVEEEALAYLRYAPEQINEAEIQRRARDI